MWSEGASSELNLLAGASQHFTASTVHESDCPPCRVYSTLDTK